MPILLNEKPRWRVRVKTKDGTYKTVSRHYTQNRASWAEIFYHLVHWNQITKIQYY